MEKQMVGMMALKWVATMVFSKVGEKEHELENGMVAMMVSDSVVNLVWISAEVLVEQMES
jgi:hypothetical protein